MKWLLLLVVACLIFWVLFGESAVDWALNIIRGGSFKPGAAPRPVVVDADAMRAVQEGRKDDTAP